MRANALVGSIEGVGGEKANVCVDAIEERRLGPARGEIVGGAELFEDVDDAGFERVVADALDDVGVRWKHGGDWIGTTRALVRGGVIARAWTFGGGVGGLGAAVVVVDGARAAEAFFVVVGEKRGDADFLPFVERGLGVVVHGFHDVALERAHLQDAVVRLNRGVGRLFRMPTDETNGIDDSSRRGDLFLIRAR